MEPLDQENVDILGGPGFHRLMVCGILDRAPVFSSAESQPPVCVNRLSAVVDHNDFPYPDYKELLYEKRGT